MLQRIKNFCLALGVFSLIAAPVAITTAVYADSSGTASSGSIGDNIACGSNFSAAAACSQGTQTTGTQDSSKINTILRLTVNIFSIIVGFVAVVMIIVGGIKYITSGGEANNVSSAKNTIVYAIIGLVIVALAQIIVHFVLAKLAGADQGTI